MMTGINHYREAERLIAHVQKSIEAGTARSQGGISELTALAQAERLIAHVQKSIEAGTAPSQGGISELTALAQVHATLALAFFTMTK